MPVDSKDVNSFEKNYEEFPKIEDPEEDNQEQSQEESLKIKSANEKENQKKTQTEAPQPNIDETQKPQAQSQKENSDKEENLKEKLNKINENAEKARQDSLSQKDGPINAPDTTGAGAMARAGHRLMEQLHERAVAQKNVDSYIDINNGDLKKAARELVADKGIEEAGKIAQELREKFHVKKVPIDRKMQAFANEIGTATSMIQDKDGKIDKDKHTKVKQEVQTQKDAREHSTTITEALERNGKNAQNAAEDIIVNKGTDVAKKMVGNSEVTKEFKSVTDAIDETLKKIDKKDTTQEKLKTDVNKRAEQQQEQQQREHQHQTTVGTARIRGK